MADNTAIEWTESTWNPIAGCSVLSPGCKHCYAMPMAARIERMMAALGKPTPYAGLTQPSKAGPVWNGRIAVASDETLTQPLRWKRPRRIFVNSMSDLFHEGVADETIDKVFAVMALCPQHTFQVLTKRAERMRAYLTRIDQEPAQETARRIAAAWPGNHPIPREIVFPLPNVWLGVSAEDQTRADERIPHLLATPAAVRFLSCEPLLGALRTDGWLRSKPHDPTLDWVIAGGESGKGARPMHPDWVRSLRDQCAAAQVPFFFKQWGEWLPVGQHLPGFGKIHGATAVEPGRMRLHYGGTPQQPPKHAYADRGVDVWSLEVTSLIFRVGKKAAGALLDGKMHREFPT